MNIKTFLLVSALITLSGCTTEIQSASGTKMAKVGALPTDVEGHTVEQNNIRDKVKIDAEMNKEWHIYVVSSYTGKIILESKSVGKITSSGKRLTPKHITGTSNGGGLAFDLSEGTTVYTDELPAEDGTFGDSTEYIYCKDDNGRNRRHYMMGGQIIHTSDKPLSLEELSVTR